MSGHSHSGAHEHADAHTNRRRLVIAFAITIVIAVGQAVGSVLTGSLALLTDTAHVFVDSVGLFVALVAAILMTRPPSDRHTWGFARVEAVAALGQAALLAVVGVYAIVEGIRRLGEPPHVPSAELLVFGAIGLAGNIAAILVLSGGRGSNLNMRAAFLEVLNDALGSLGVITAAIVIATTGFQQADALAGLFIALLILPRAFVLLRDAMRVLLDFTPRGVDLAEVREHILATPHVLEVHDLHASVIGTGLPVISAHVVLDDECFTSGHAPKILEEIRTCIAGHFPVSFEHSTIQLETAAIRDAEAGPALHA